MFVGDNPPAAVKAWMDTNGVTASAGNFTDSTPVVNLAVAPPISAHKEADKALQQALKDKGFYDGPVDGSIGPKTQEAIKAFKIKNGLKADSIAGPNVKKLLGL